jgi:hypothetical protein
LFWKYSRKHFLTDWGEQKSEGFRSNMGMTSDDKD